MNKGFLLHVIAGMTYSTVLAVSTYMVSGGDIAYWMACITLFAIQFVVVILSKNKKQGFLALLIVLIIIIVSAKVSDDIYTRNKSLDSNVPPRIR